LDCVTQGTIKQKPPEGGFAPGHRNKYREQDQARLRAWRNGEWHFVGMRARATLKIPHGSNPVCWITTDLLSPGLWGIESDCGEHYLEEVYRDERDELLRMLASLKTCKVTE
jgi:hypothetical protein